jgi:hypothetical protein
MFDLEARLKNMWNRIEHVNGEVIFAQKNMGIVGKKKVLHDEVIFELSS